MTRKFDEAYQEALVERQKWNQEGVSYLDWLEEERLDYIELRNEISHIIKMITLLYPQIIPPEGGSLAEIIGSLISKASRNTENYAE